MRKRLIAATFLAVAAPFVLSGCSGGSSTAGTSGGDVGGGGGGGGATITGLAVADKVSVVDAQTTGTSKLVAKMLGLTVGTSDSAYNTDKTSSYVHDRSTEAFKVVN